MHGHEGAGLVVYVVSPTSRPDDVAATLLEAMGCLGSCCPGSLAASQAFHKAVAAGSPLQLTQTAAPKR